MGNTDIEDLEKKVVDRTQDAHEWKLRAETAERKLLEVTKSDGIGRRRSDNVNVSTSSNNPKDMFLQAAIDRNTNNTNNRRSWSLFGASTNSNGNPATSVGGNNNFNSNSSEKVSDDENDKENDNNIMTNQIKSLNETIATLRSEIVQLSSKQKEESYIQ